MICTNTGKVQGGQHYLVQTQDEKKKVENHIVKKTMEKFQTPMFSSGIANKGLYQFSNRKNSFYSVTKKKNHLFLKLRNSSLKSEK